MKGFIYRVVRTLQVNFPQLQDARFMVQRMYRQWFKIPVEDDFSALNLFGFEPQALMIDAGANRGDTVRAIRLTYPENKVMAFEPNPIVYELSRKSFVHDANTTFVNAGLSDKDEALELNIPFYKKYMFDGLASFKEDEALDWLKTRIYFFNEKDLSLKKVKCSLKKLDDYNTDPAFIKIDVQGYELSVLKGAAKTIEQSKPVLLIETPTGAVSDHLASIGYRPFSYSKTTGLASGYGGLNTFFVNQASKVFSKMPL